LSLKKIFSMKDLGDVVYILGIKIYDNRFRRLIGLSQGVYVDKVLKIFNMKDFKKRNISISRGIDIVKKHYLSMNAELETMKKILYASPI
jgi:hypothetical protein